jgi:hypothetical protein
METKFKELRGYLYQSKKTFVVPNYQRGYKWAIKEGDNLSAVEKLMADLIKAYNSNTPSYFIQGITVSEDGNNIILIDGQQRTTTLYLLLWCIDPSHIKNIDLQYDIRKESKEYINNLKNNSQKENESKQDIFYFKQAIDQIQTYLKDIDDKERFLTYVLDHVQILYIVIDKEKATKTFTMMNGSKATMLQEELIKAEMLRLISLPDIETKEVSTSVDENLSELKEIISKDWETNALRSRYAREWDKWLYWWNRKEVKDFFGKEAETPMGLLLEYCYLRQNDHSTQEKLKENINSFNFDNFKSSISDKKQTKEQFKKIRDLQKSFEDIYTKPKIHNYLKLSLICSQNAEDKFEIIKYFISKKHEDDFKDDYAKWRLVGATHLEIIDPERSSSNETKESRAERALEGLSDPFVYQSDYYDIAAKQLLRLNVEEDNKLLDGKGRKFDFSIYGNKSLEHIHPKSKVYYKEVIQSGDAPTTIVYRDGNDNDIGSVEPQGDEWLNRDTLDGCTEHSIGNLLLLDKDENSKFSNHPFEKKKGIYFNVNEVFKSRNLLHTISVFAKSTWNKEEIEQNQKAFIERFEKDYGVKLNNTNNG